MIDNIIKKIKNIKTKNSLDLSLSNLSTIPKELGNLTNLKELYLYNNQIESIPKEIEYIISM